MRSSCKTDASLSVLGGTLLGAAAMYLLDPEAGRRRRQRLADATGDALHTTGGALGTAWERAREVGSTLGERAGEVSARALDQADDWRHRAARSALVTGLASKLGDFGQGVAERARHLSEGASDRAGEWSGAAAERARSMSHGARHRLARAIDPEHVRDPGPGRAVGLAAGGLGTLALGAGLMWLLDPDRGRARRNSLCQTGTKILNETGTACRRTGRHLMNRLRGTMHEARGQFRQSSQADVDGERLLHRIRAEVGHVLTYPTAVQLMTDAQGVVTLYGRVPASEVDGLLSTIHSVRGVSRIVNRLDVCDTLAAVAAGPGGASAGATSGSTGFAAGQTAPQI